MPTVSVKLADEIKLRLNRLAVSQGVTAHSIMVGAIEARLSDAESHSSFVADALRSRKQVVDSGQVIVGAAFGEYLKAKARGLKVTRPQTVHIESLLTRA